MKPLNREISRIALPSIAQNVTVPLLGLADAAISGHLGGAEYIGAVAVGGMIFNMLYWLCAFLRMSTGGLTAQAVGRSANPTPLLMRALRIGLALALLLVALQVPLGKLAFAIMDAPPQVEPLARTYFNILIWGAPAVLMTYGLSGWFLGRQDARTPMVVAIAQNIINILLSLIFVMVFDMKVEGVALGTLIAQWWGVAMFLFAPCAATSAEGESSKKPTYSYIAASIGAWRSKSASPAIAPAENLPSGKASIEISLFLRTLCMVIVQVYFTRAGAAQGDVVLAANSLLMQFYLLFSYFVDGLAYAGEAVGGKRYGAADRDGFNALTRRLFLWGIVLTAIFTLLYYLCGATFLSLLTDNADVAQAARRYLPYACVLPLCGMATFLYDGLCVGTTSTRLLLASVVAGMVAFFLIIFLHSSSADANDWLWLAMLAFLVARGLTQAIFYRTMLPTQPDAAANIPPKKRKPLLLRILKWTVGILLFVILLLGSGTYLLNTSRVQQWLLGKATKTLSEKLHTQVSADSVSMNLFNMSLSLYGLDIKDQQGGDLFSMKRLSGDVSLESIWERTVVVNSLETDGLQAQLVKHSDSTTNYDFLKEALQKKPKPEDKDEDEKLNIELHELNMSDTRLTYLTDSLTATAQLRGFSLYESFGTYALGIDSLKVTTDNHKPRRNTGRPRRGWFDAGHVAATVCLKADITPIGKDSLSARLYDGTISDPTAGFDIRGLELSANANKTHIYLKDISLNQKTTNIKIESAAFTLPDKAAARKLSFKTGTIRARAILKDISRLFVPALKNFSIPLNVSATMSGEGDRIHIHHAHVTSDDHNLDVRAGGTLYDLSKKHAHKGSFRVSHVTARNGIAERIINQFLIKKLMMKQLRLLGTISYKGGFQLEWKRVTFNGTVGTNQGNIATVFTVDSRVKWLSGKVSTTNFHLGKVMDMKHLGDITCQANFKIDISKERTKLMRKQKGGKLPIGSVSATIDDSSYRRIHIRHILADITSDGAEAQGSIVKQGKWRDLSCQFSFTDTEDMNKLKITHPGIKFHKKRKFND